MWIQSSVQPDDPKVFVVTSVQFVEAFWDKLPSVTLGRSNNI